MYLFTNTRYLMGKIHLKFLKKYIFKFIFVCCMSHVTASETQDNFFMFILKYFPVMKKQNLNNFLHVDQQIKLVLKTYINNKGDNLDIKISLIYSIVITCIYIISIEIPTN